MVKLIAKGNWSNTTVGVQNDGDEFSADEKLADSLVKRGYAKPAKQTKPAKTDEGKQTKPEPEKPGKQTK